MTYRERREQRAANLQDWSAKREQKATDQFQQSHDATSMIPFGQPILVGHHSEKRHRNAIAKANNAADAALENARTAERMAEKAGNIERQLRASIYDDDPDAVEQLERKLTSLLARREAMKQANAAYRREHRVELKGMTVYQRHTAVPYPAYELQNLGGVISTTRARLERLRREQVTGPRDRVITARFDSECADCGADLKAGETIRYNRGQGARCLACLTLPA